MASLLFLLVACQDCNVHGDSCAVLADGALRCWDDDCFNQLP